METHIDSNNISIIKAIALTSSCNIEAIDGRHVKSNTHTTFNHEFIIG